VVMYGTRATAEVRAEKIQPKGTEGTEFDVVIGNVQEHAKLPLVGEHNVLNVLAAVAVGVERGLRPAEAVTALATLAPSDKRGQVLKLGNITVINDCYNSNPKALEAMVDALATMRAKRRIVVAGEMLELGAKAEKLHRLAGEHIAERKIDVLLGVRGLAYAMVESARQAGTQAVFMVSPEEAGEWLARESKDGDVVLLKASRGVKLEKALETWKARRDGT
jgi:UDP-N-acetylmuramoyl-tripeptide--D-alanyl-D-alanine ligase